MNRGTLLVLLFLAGGLTFAWVKKEQAEAEGKGHRLAAYPLAPGLDRGRVTSVFIDHLERGIQVKLERDLQGSWFMTDPLVYPALDELVRSLIQTVASASGEPSAGIGAKEAGLDPPRIVLTLGEPGPDGTTVRHRIEIGAPDLDPLRIHVRVPGNLDPTGAAPGGADVILRAPRSLYSTLDRNPDDYRETRVTGMRGATVTSFRRSGSVFLQEVGGELDLEFAGHLEPDGWKTAVGPRVTLDPRAMQLVSRGAAELKAIDFLDDAPQGLERYGLDPPAFTVEIANEFEERARLLFGHFPHEGEPRSVEDLSWNVMLEGSQHVLAVDPISVMLLVRPVDQLYDFGVVRAFRRDVTGLELSAGTRTLRLEREGREERAQWFVQEDGAEGTASGVRYAADGGRVEDALAKLELLELGDYPPVGSEPGDGGGRSLAVITQSGVRWGGDLGREYKSPTSGMEGRLFLRFGDERVGLIDRTAAELCDLGLDHFRSKVMHSVEESLLHSIELGHDGREFRYVREADDWFAVAAGRKLKAPTDFVILIDGLRNLKVEAWASAVEAGTLSDVVEARLVRRPGPELVFSLGRRPDGTVFARTPDGRVARMGARLYEGLLALLQEG